MGVEGSHTYSKSGNMDKLSTPPGFVSQTTFVLRNVHQDRESSRSGQEQITGFGMDGASFKLSLHSRPWIVHDHKNPTSETLKPIKPEVRERRIQRVSNNVTLEEAPVFNPTEEEFSDTLTYTASLRDKAEPYGICCVVPPPSWKPPCLLEDKEIWEVSKFDTQVQLFDANDTMVKKEEADDDDNDDHTSESVKFCRVERGTRKTLETFKNFADSYKKKHFSAEDEVLGSKSSSTPSVKPEPIAYVEKEYRQLVESPLVEIEVLCGNDLDTRTFSSGFPLPGGPSESCKYKTSGWNLNNTAKLPASLLSFEDCESVGVPRLSVGMFLSSQLWKSEKDRLYSLCYLHMGAPRVWYSVAGCHRSKVMNLFPEMSGEQQSKMSREPVMMMSPYALNMEGIPVTRCVQYPGQYVILFPGSCYSAVNCGFNCLEKANFAPIDWLPHGDVAVHQNQEKKKRSLISYDKILLGAAREAVKHLKEYSLSKKKTADDTRWFNACGREGLFTSIVKVCMLSLPLLC
ncbi:inactive lysine-specific demethylase JMJ19 [Hirschfeldia incana]|nr:inactive lysine-specific demethylase JMJ19 [Hirschfeldia incana]